MELEAEEKDNFLKELEKMVEELEFELNTKNEKMEELKKTIENLEKDKEEYKNEKEKVKKQFIVDLIRKQRNNLQCLKLNMKKWKMKEELKTKK